MCFEDDILMREIDAACIRNGVQSGPHLNAGPKFIFDVDGTLVKSDESKRTTLVIRAWENGPISFHHMGLLFMSKELEKLIPEALLCRI
jgi:hypothetical protein